ncbi:MAG: excinuclease ABC subunit A, partial [Candidatus Paceibacteria bacterium]
SNISAGPLRMAKLDLPLSGWVDINGPSGSGKSTLLFDVLQASFDAGLPVGCEAIDLEGNMLHFRKVVGAQRPQRNGTVIGALDLMKPMQQLFHGQSSEVDLPLQAFSFLSPKGRCNSCNGSGQERISMDFMADLDLPCPTCGGKRYRSEVLTVQWEGLDAAQFLEQHATPLMALLPSGKLKRAIAALEQVGLGYLTLGRGLKTLSGGEVQRLALARGLASTDHPSLFLFDHPDAGLHNSNLEQIVKAFKDLSTRGNLVVTTARSLVLHKAANVGLTL